MAGGGLNLFRYHLGSWLCLFVALLCSNTAAWSFGSCLLGPLQPLPPLVLPRRWATAVLCLLILQPVSILKLAAPFALPAAAVWVCGGSAAAAAVGGLAACGCCSSACRGSRAIGASTSCLITLSHLPSVRASQLFWGGRICRRLLEQPGAEAPLWTLYSLLGMLQ